MTPLFITIGMMDVVDILLVALLLYEIYKLVKGTAAFNIFIGIFVFYLAWLLIKALNMQLLSSILGQFIGVGVLALIIVFQPEIRRLFMVLGTRYKLSQTLSLDNLFMQKTKSTTNEHIKEIVNACLNMARTYTGALIVISRKNELREFSRTGEKINARISQALIETIFFKNSALHDGAMIVHGNKIAAARCILPVTDKNVDGKLGLRHRAAIGLTEATDAQVVVVSEETGRISYVVDGAIHQDLGGTELIQLLEIGLRNINEKEAVE
ncbi:TIGR00159 family protein [Prolixibacteraceae bacterium JC049]|nr:TIGR00159 family protein [Prolixibacteraceae bacterium JC049]